MRSFDKILTFKKGWYAPLETEKPRGIAALFGGSPQQVLCAFDIAWPAVMESVFVALAGLIDSLMVSTLGAAAVASVGLTTQPKFIALSLFIALNVSVSALVARRKGQKDRDGANQVLMMALGFTLVMGLVLGAVCIAFAPTFMDLAGSNAETHDNAVLYFRIVVGGMIFSVLSLIINAAQRGSGNTRLSMRANVASSLVNITFNWLLINGHLGFPALGMKGAALATVLGTVVACCMSISSILREDSFVSIPYMLRKKVRPGAENALVMVKLCASCFVEQIFMRIGFMATAVMAADLGTAPMAAHQVGMNFLSLSFAFGDGMQVAAITLVGQSLGQKDPALARRYGRVCQRMGFCISVVLSIIFLTQGRNIYRLFFSEEAIVADGVMIMRMMTIITLMQIAQVVYMSCLRAGGDVLYTTIASTVSVTLVRTIACYILCYPLNLGLFGLWLGISSDQCSRLIFSSIRFASGRWTQKKL